MTPTRSLAIRKQNLRSAAREAIIELVLSGTISPGQRLNETHLSGQLEISQTPIREALISLENESFLVSSPGRGFVVRELSSREVEDIYPVMALLESFALKQVKSFSAECISDLKSLNQQFLHAKNVTAACEADRCWHERLTKDCPNEFLLAQLKMLRRSAYRYELAFMRSQPSYRTSVSQHNNIIQAIAKRQTTVARKWLEKNCLISVEPIKKWLESSQSNRKNRTES